MGPYYDRTSTKMTAVRFETLKIFYLFIFRKRGRGGKIKGEKLQCVVASRAPCTGDLACNPGRCPD